MFEPTEEETAISPKPLRATMTLVNKSGIEVPAAKKVSPITYKETKKLQKNFQKLPIPLVGKLSKRCEAKGSWSKWLKKVLKNPENWVKPGIIDKLK